MDLAKFKDEISRQAFGMTKEEAHQKEICVDCKKPIIPKLKTEVDRREYAISGLCSACFAKMSPDDDPAL